jgi:ketosteroid isomerase-like protein
MDHVQFVRQTWEAISHGDLKPLEAALAPDAKWRAVVDGPWNCESRDAILDVMKGNLSKGLSGQIDEAFISGDRVVVAFRPDHHEPGAWPLDDGVRYVVLTVREDLVTGMKGCADRRTALQYAETS